LIKIKIEKKDKSVYKEEDRQLTL